MKQVNRQAGHKFVGYVAMAKHLTGAIAAARKQFDLFGLVVFAALVGLGGDTLREILWGRLPVFWLLAPWNLALTTAVALLSFFVMRWVTRWQRLFIWADVRGLATYAIVGSAMGLEAGASPYLAPLFGVFTGCFGGFMRALRWSPVWSMWDYLFGGSVVLPRDWGWPPAWRSLAASIIWGIELPRAAYPR